MIKSQRKSGAILSYVSIIVNTLVQLLYIPFLISKLGQSEYGLYSLVASIIGYLGVLDLGFGNAIVVHTAKYRALEDKENEQILHGMFHLIYICIGVIAGLAGVIISFFTESIFGGSMTPEDVAKMRIMLLILSFNIFLTFAFSIYSSIITASEAFVFQKTLAILSTIAKPLLMIPILLIGYKSIALCIVITIVNIVILFANYLFCKRKLKVSVKFRGFNWKMFRKVFSYSFYVFLAQIVDQINWSADQTILGVVSGTIAVSVYSAAAQINTMFINLSTAISGVMLPKISKMVAKKADGRALSDELIKVGRIQFLVVFLVTSGFILVGKEFIRMWLGEGFDESYIVTLLLILPMVVPLIQNVGLSILQAKNKFKFRAIITLVMAGLNILLSIFLAKMYGASGAAVGTTISLVICNMVIMNIYYWKNIGLDIFRFWKNIVVMLIKFLVPILVTVLLISLTDLHGWVAIISYAIFYLVFYTAVAYFFVMNNYEKHFVDSILRRFHIK